jgi:hypothetical protein
MVKPSSNFYVFNKTGFADGLRSAGGHRAFAHSVAPVTQAIILKEYKLA